MNQEIKTKWVTALKSGEYIQGRDALKTEQGYCCLGVLCDLYMKETGKGAWVKDSKKNLFDFNLENSTNYGVLPADVCEWSGLRDDNPSVSIEVLEKLKITEKIDFGTGARCLSNFNDIANAIIEGL